MPQDVNSSVEELQDLCAWASVLKFEDLPQDVLRRAKWVLLDDIGAILGGSLEPEMEALRQTYLTEQTFGQSTVLAKGFPKTNRFTAAELNGMAGCFIEMDEGYRLATSHAGIYSIPALLALAEHLNMEMKNVLTALVVGYEFGARFAEAWTFPPLMLHPHGVFVTIAATAACAKLCNLSKDEMFRTITTASALTLAAPYDHAVKGAMVRNLWTGVGARLGLLAIEASKSKVYGIISSTDSVFCTIYNGDYQPGKLTQDLGQRYAISSGYHKIYACCQYAHSALDAVLEIRKKKVNETGKVEIPKKIIVSTHPKGLSLDQVHPETTLGSKFSLRHAVAAAWVLGHAGRAAFVRKILNDPVIREIREKIELVLIEEIGPPPMDRPARVKVIFPDGSEAESFMPNATGDPTKPIDERMLCEKFSDTTSEIFTEPTAIAQTILNLSGTELTRVFIDTIRQGGK